MNHLVHVLYRTAPAEALLTWSGQGSLLSHILNQQLAAVRRSAAAAAAPLPAVDAEEDMDRKIYPRRPRRLA